jgi:hypothetical protein
LGEYETEFCGFRYQAEAFLGFCLSRLVTPPIERNGIVRSCSFLNPLLAKARNQALKLFASATCNHEVCFHLSRLNLSITEFRFGKSFWTVC